MTNLKSVGTRTRKFLSKHGDSELEKLLLVTVAIFLFMSILNPGMFFTSQNFVSMMFQAPELGFFSIAMTFVIISGGIDLSVVAMANMSAIASAYVMQKAVESGFSTGGIIGVIVLLFCMGAAIGLVCGAMNGFIIARFNINPMLATLGTMYLFTGISIVITEGKSIYGMPEQLLVIGSGYILHIPIPMWMLIIFTIIASVILNRTAYGFDLKMLGSNSKASRYTGIHNEQVIMKTYILSGVLSGLAGVEFLARTNSAKADFGSSYVLHAILCVLLGGVNPNGGHGKISGVILGLTSLQFLASGFNMLRVSAFFKDFMWGLLLLLVMVMHFISNNRKMHKGIKK